MKYELMVILPGDITEKEALKHLETVKKYVTDNGGVISEEMMWGKRDLAYRIKKHDVGFYATYHFEMNDKTAMAELKNELKLDQIVLRELIITIPEDYSFSEFKETEAESQKVLAEIMEKRKKSKKDDKKTGKPESKKVAAKADEKKEKLDDSSKKKTSSDEILNDPDLAL